LKEKEEERDRKKIWLDTIEKLLVGAYRRCGRQVEDKNNGGRPKIVGKEANKKKEQTESP